MEIKKKYFMDCNLAGRKYHDVDEVWSRLNVGTLVRLERDLDNRYDQNAVAVMYDETETEETYCLGYIPRGKNETIATLLEMGWGDVFECRICKIDPDTHPENQIQLTIRVKRK